MSTLPAARIVPARFSAHADAVAWRETQLVAAGLPLNVAQRVASDLIDPYTVARGCAFENVLRILV